MRALLQRVSEAKVDACSDASPPSIVKSESIAQGLLILVGFRSGDTEAELEWMARKIVGLRVFADQDGKMNLSIRDKGGEILMVSQFTLYANAQKGNRPSFEDAALPAEAGPLYDRFIGILSRESGRTVKTGVFGAHMEVCSVNDGPVTLLLERECPASPPVLP